jgi:hypothetical protein
VELGGAAAEGHGLAAGAQQGGGGAGHGGAGGVGGFGQVLPFDGFQRGAGRSAVVGERGTEGGVVREEQNPGWKRSGLLTRALQWVASRKTWESAKAVDCPEPLTVVRLWPAKEHALVATRNVQTLRRWGQAAAVGEDDELGAVAGADFDHGPVHMGLDGGRAEHELRGDFVVGQTGGDECGDLPFPAGQ